MHNDTKDVCYFK